MALTAEQWYEKECKEQNEHYEKTKKAKRRSEPKESEFISKAEYDKVIGNFINDDETMIVKLCDNPEHVGERLMKYTFKHFDKANGTPSGKCKSCVSNKKKRQREEKQNAKKEASIGRFKTGQEYFDYFNSKCNNNTDGRNHRFYEPKREEFATTKAYDDAVALKRQRDIEGDSQRASRAEYYERDKPKQQERWHNKTKEEKTAVIRRQNAQRKIRKLNLRKDEIICEYSNHVCNLADVIFCPKADLGMVNWRGEEGQIRRPACRKHYEQHRKSDNKYKQKYRENLKLRWRFRLEWWRHKCKLKKKTISLTHEEQVEMIRSNCYYCDKISTDAKLNGIDMMDAMNRDYNAESCVPCCAQCNWSKGCLKADEYIEVCQNITNFQELGLANTQYIPYRQCYRDKQDGSLKDICFLKADSYIKYKREAPKRNIEFEITEDDYNRITSQGCTYCGLMNTKYIGLDRIDSSKGYTKENLTGACVSCNFVKRKYDLSTFLKKCKEVAECFR